MNLAFFTTFFIFLSGICVAWGWWLIRRGKREAHIKVMVLAAVLATTFFILYMARTVIVGNTAFGGPESVSPIYHTFLIFHIILSTIGGVMGIISLYLGYKQKFDKHRKIGPYTSVIWLATAATGLAVYLLLYIIYPPGETTNVFRAIFGW